MQRLRATVFPVSSDAWESSRQQAFWNRAPCLADDRTSSSAWDCSSLALDPFSVPRKEVQAPAVFVLGRKPTTESLVCARQRPLQFPLHPYSEGRRDEAPRRLTAAGAGSAAAGYFFAALFTSTRTKPIVVLPTFSDVCGPSASIQPCSPAFASQVSVLPSA